MEDCVSDKCNPRVIVDLKGDRRRHTSNTVKVKKQKQTVNKGKNIVHLFTEGAMSDSPHESESEKANNGDQNYCISLPAANKTLACTNLDKCPLEGTWMIMSTPEINTL